MKKILRSLLTLLTLTTCSNVYAQALPIDKLTPPLPTQTERKVADILSWGTVLTTVAIDAVNSWNTPDDILGNGQRIRAFEKQGIRVGLVLGSSYILKSAFGRTRPCAPDCGLDNPYQSFPSEHTMFAFSSLGGPRLSVQLPLAITTQGLRIAAGKHWLTDTLAGAGIGYAISFIR